MGVSHTERGLARANDSESTGDPKAGALAVFHLEAKTTKQSKTTFRWLRG